MTRFGKLSFAEAIGLIETRLREAVETLKDMMLERHDLPDKVRSAWPSVVHDWDAYSGELMKFRQEHAVNRPAAPSPDAIDRMDQAMKWLLAVKNGDRRIVMGRAAGFSWRQLEDKDGRCMRTLQNVHSGALEAILTSMVEEA